MMERAADNPDLVISFIETEQTERKKGKKAFDEFALLNSTDLEDIRDFAGTVGNNKDVEEGKRLKAIEDKNAREMLARSIDETTAMTKEEAARRVVSTGDDRIPIVTFNAVVAAEEKKKTNIEKVEKEEQSVADDKAKAELVAKKRPSRENPNGTLTVDDISAYLKRTDIDVDETWADTQFKAMANTLVEDTLNSQKAIISRAELIRKISEVKREGKPLESLSSDVSAMQAAGQLTAKQAEDMLASIDFNLTAFQQSIRDSEEKLARARIAPSSGSLKPIGTELIDYAEYLIEYDSELRKTKQLDEPSMRKISAELTDKHVKSTIRKLRQINFGIIAKKDEEIEQAIAIKQAMLRQPLSMQKVLLKKAQSEGLISKTPKELTDEQYINQLLKDL